MFARKRIQGRTSLLHRRISSSLGNYLLSCYARRHAPSFSSFRSLPSSVGSGRRSSAPRFAPDRDGWCYGASPSGDRVCLSRWPCSATSSPLARARDAVVEVVDPDLGSAGSCYISPDSSAFAKIVHEGGGRQSLHVRGRSGAVWDVLFKVPGVGSHAAFSADGCFLFYTRVDFRLRACELWVTSVRDPSGSTCVLREGDPNFHLYPYLSGKRMFVRVASASCSETLEVVSDGRGWRVRQRVGRDLGLPHWIYASPLGDGRDALLARVAGSDGQTVLYVDFKGSDAWGSSDPRSWTEVFRSSLSEALVEVHVLPGTRSFLSLREHGRPGVAVIDFAVPSSPSIERLDYLAGMRGFVRLVDVVPERRCGRLSVVDEAGEGRAYEVDVDSLSATSLGSSWHAFETAGPIVIEELSSHRVPNLSLTMVRRADLRCDGRNPGILHVYGCYGACQDVDSGFELSPLVDAGVIVAVAHVRGGGELGSAWHFAGRFPLKLNAVSDLEECARLLVESGWVDGDKLGSSSGSAGSAVALTAINRGVWRPCACVCHSPFVDASRALRRDADPVSRTDLVEFGDPAGDSENRRLVRAVSPVSGVRSLDYPEFFVTTGGADSRVSNLDVFHWILKVRLFSRRPVWLSHAPGSGHDARDSSAEFAFWMHSFSSVS